MKRRHLLATAIPTILLGATAYGVRAPTYLRERAIEVASGSTARAFAQRSFVTPRPATTEWNNFLASHGKWEATWDADTGVASTIVGEGIASPGAVADATAAESFARNALAEQMALLAPGSSIDDFTVLSNVASNNLRVVRFAQHYRGLPVVNAQVMFVFEHDHLVEMGSSAMPQVTADIPSSLVSPSVAINKAVAWVGGVYHSTPQVLSTGDAKILPIIRDSKAGIEYRTVVPVIVDQASPQRAQWDVYVDAATGEPIARHQRLYFNSGTLTYHTPVRYPLGGFGDFPAPYANVTVNGGAATTTALGVVSWATGSPVPLIPALAGTFANVTNNDGSNNNVTGNLQLADGQSASWDESSSETTDAQLAAYINANNAKAFAIANYGPYETTTGNAWFPNSIPVFVNESGTCNAYSNLDDIHFFPSGQGCNNTGEITDVLYHEFGHSLHSKTRGDGGTGTDDGSLSEGVADTNAFNMIGDPDLGLGFFTGMETMPLRQANPPDKEFKWPDDSNSGDPHTTGQIISGAMWDMRTSAFASMGNGPGQLFFNKIYVGILAVANDIPSTYQAALVADDDDGDLSNGTPNMCLIQNAFGPHGLGSAGSLGSLAPPTVDNLTITLSQPTAGNGTCQAPQIASAVVTWRLRSDNTQTGTVNFTASGASFTATLPSQADGEVIEYSIAATMDNGANQAFPLNKADQWYQLYVGPKTDIYATDFESTDPTTDGWTLGTGWAYGTPAPSGQTDDPHTAFSGSKEIGINLSGDYDPSSTYDATSKTIDVSAYAGVPIHLQFERWLGVEDGIYDHATISVNGTQVWANGQGDGSLEFEDNEWRFTDIDVSQYATGGTIQVKFHLDSDPGLQFGGWNVDDFHLIAVQAPAAVCGNGTVDTGEQCDDGNTTDGDGCSSTCQDETGGGGGGGCCSTTDAGGAGSLLLGLFVGGMVIVRRRRK